MYLNEFVLFEKLAKMTTRQWCFAAGALVVMVGLLIYLAKRPQKQGKTDVRDAVQFLLYPGLSRLQVGHHRPESFDPDRRQSDLPV